MQRLGFFHIGLFFIPQIESLRAREATRDEQLAQVSEIHSKLTKELYFTDYPHCDNL